MKIGFAIGNGTTREGFDLEKLRGHGTIIGCNWLYRDFHPDILVAIDSEPRKALAQVTERRFQLLTVMKDRSSLSLDGMRVMLTRDVNRTIGLNTGLIACSYLAKKLECQKVYMLGFDFFRHYPGMETNDVYCDEVFDRPGFDRAFRILASDCLDTEFIRVGPIWPDDKEFYQVMDDYFTLIHYPEFEKRIESGKL